jgi:hypothetical protein
MYYCCLFLIVALFLEKESLTSFLSCSLMGAGITLLTVAVLYLPFYTSPLTFSAPFDFLFHQNPAKSISEIVGDIVYFAPTVIHGANGEVQSNMATPSGISAQQLHSWLLVKTICQIFALLVSAVVFVRFWLEEKTRTASGRGPSYVY